MKLTLKEKMRIGVLKTKAADALTAEEKTELEALEAKCKQCSLDIELLAKEYAPDADDGDDGAKALGSEELTKLITDAVKSAIPAGSGVDMAVLVKEIQDAGGKSASDLTAEKVEEVMKKHIGGTAIDKDALVKSIKDAMPKQGLTQDDLAKALDNFAASIKQKSANQFPANGGSNFEMDFPFAHRSGNLSVGEKQLLNICLANVSKGKKEEMRGKGVQISDNPEDMNFGITKDQLEYAERRGAQQLKSLRNSVVYGGKVLTTGGTGSGAELVPTDLSSELMTRFYLESALASEFLASEVQMPTAVFKFPMTTTRTAFYVGSENPQADPTGSEPGTGEITLDAKKLIGMSEYSYEADEDSIIAVLPMLQENLSQGAADAFEGALINGDVSATHQDSDIHAVASHSSKLFKGLRKMALGSAAGALKTSLSSGGISGANIRAMRKIMKRWGVKPRDLMLIVGPQGYNDIVGLDETLTFEKVGSAAAARVLTGEATSIYGIRIVVSSLCREDLNASGVYDGSTTTKGSILLVHRPSFIVGVKRGFTIEVDVDKKRQKNSVIASFRRDFVPKETPSGSIPLVVCGYNYAS